MITFFKNYWIALISFLSVLLITLFFYMKIQEWAEERRESGFQMRTAIIESMIERRMSYYVQLLRTGNSFFSTVDTVTRASWRKFVQGMNFEENFPGIQGMGFSLYIPPARLEEHIRRIRKEGFPEYSVVPGGPRKEYTSVIFLEPFNWRNQRALGYDMFSDSVRREAMERARDYNLPSLSGKVLLVQETDEDVQAGFLIYTPVYKNGADPGSIKERRENLVGYVYSPFRSEDFIEGIFNDRIHEVDFEIFDGRNISEKALLYNSNRTLNYKNRGDSELIRISYVSLAGHTWTIFFSAKPSFGFPSDRNLGYTVLVGGFIIGLLVFFVIFFISKGRQDEARSKEKLARQNEELRRINNDLDNFIYTASHDLKAPVSNLEGLFNTLLSEVRLSEDMLPLKNMIEASFERFKSTLRDLTEITKAQKGEPGEAETVKFSDIVNEVTSGIKDQIKKYQADIQTEFGVPEIRFSRKNLRSILYNLISNGIKYSSPERRPLIRISTKRRAGFVVLTVSDNGLGIPPESREKIFEMFKRVHDHVEGTGVGLYIVKRIADNAGGKIEVESELGKGTTFRVYLKSDSLTNK